MGHSGLRKTMDLKDKLEMRNHLGGYGASDIQKMKIMGSGPITSWEIDGETV